MAADETAAPDDGDQAVAKRLLRCDQCHALSSLQPLAPVLHGFARAPRRDNNPKVKFFEKSGF
jgi:hypothetical protein